MEERLFRKQLDIGSNPIGGVLDGLLCTRRLNDDVPLLGSTSVVETIVVQDLLVLYWRYTLSNRGNAEAREGRNGGGLGYCSTNG